MCVVFSVFCLRNISDDVRCVFFWTGGSMFFLNVHWNNSNKRLEWAQTYKHTERSGISHYLWGEFLGRATIFI